MHKKREMTKLVHDANGRVAIPIMLYFLGVPGLLVFILWVLFFRG